MEMGQPRPFGAHVWGLNMYLSPGWHSKQSLDAHRAPHTQCCMMLYTLLKRVVVLAGPAYLAGPWSLVAVASLVPAAEGSS